MSKVVDISAKMSIASFIDELNIPEAVGSIGNTLGGLSMFSSSFKRGYGDAVFGSSELGIWLGAADFVNAPFSVDMNGNLIATSATISGYSKVSIFKQTSIPTSVSVGDLWFDTDDDNICYRAASVGATTIAAGKWEAVDDQRAADALLKAGSSQTLSGSFLIGGANMKMDGANNRFVTTDGSNNRIVIGNV